jgi:hypothetical protein
VVHRRIAPRRRDEARTLPYAVTVSASALTLDLLAWIDTRPRTYDETIEAWKTSCPRLSVWDDAVTDGLVRIDRRAENRAIVVLSAPGRAALVDAALPVENERDGAVVHERDLHSRSEDARLHSDA